MFKIKEKFIIRTAMSQSEVWKNLEDSIRSYKSWYDSLPAEENKEFVGKFQGNNFEMTRTLAMSKGRQPKGATPDPKIKGEIKEGSVVIEIEISTFIILGFYGFGLMLGGTFITILLVLLKHGMKSEYFEEQIFIIFSFILYPFVIFAQHWKVSNEKVGKEKEFLKNLFNGTIEEINSK